MDSSSQELVINEVEVKCEEEEEEDCGRGEDIISCLICLSSDTGGAQSWKQCFWSAAAAGDGREEPLSLSRNVSTVFLLRNLLQVESGRVASLLSTTTFGVVEPGAWVRLCGECSEHVRKAYQLHQECCKLQRKIETIGETLRKEIRKSWKGLEPGLEEQVDGGGGRGGVLSVHQLIRDLFQGGEGSNNGQEDTAPVVRADIFENEVIIPSSSTFPNLPEEDRLKEFQPEPDGDPNDDDVDHGIKVEPDALDPLCILEEYSDQEEECQQEHTGPSPPPPPPTAKQSPNKDLNNPLGEEVVGLLPESAASVLLGLGVGLVTLSPSAIAYDPSAPTPRPTMPPPPHLLPPPRRTRPSGPATRTMRARIQASRSRSTTSSPPPPRKAPPKRKNGGERKKGQFTCSTCGKVFAGTSGASQCCRKAACPFCMGEIRYNNLKRHIGVCSMNPQRP